MCEVTIPQIAGAILDGVQRRIVPLTHAELMAVNRECARLRQKPTERRMAHKWRDLDKYKPEPISGARGAFLGLWGLVLVVGAWIRG